MLRPESWVVLSLRERSPFAVSLVILDVDGTLVDFVGAIRSGLLQ